MQSNAAITGLALPSRKRHGSLSQAETTPDCHQVGLLLLSIIAVPAITAASSKSPASTTERNATCRDSQMMEPRTIFPLLQAWVRHGIAAKFS